MGDLTQPSCSKSSLGRNDILQGISPTIKKMAVKYRWAFDSMDDAISEITLKMIRVIDRGISQPRENYLSWFAFLCKKEAHNLVFSRKKIDEPIGDMPDEAVPSGDITDSIAVNQALKLMRPKSADALVKFHVEGMSADEVGVNKAFLHDARDQFRRALNGEKANIGPNRMDKTKYSFLHESGASFTGTRVDFCAAYGIAKTGAHKLVAGVQATHKGWRMNK